jgi:hypothetical protein
LIGGDMRPVYRGDPTEHRFTAFYLDGSRLVGALSMNTGTEIKHGTNLIAARAQVPAEVLADRSVEFRQLARAVVPIR